jgi:hypothetical protein
MEVFDNIGPATLGMIGLVVLLQVTLQVIAIVQLVKTPADRVSIGGRKWLWAIIILLGEIIGPVLWFVLGRTAAPADVPTAPVQGETARTAVDAIYGAPKE